MEAGRIRHFILPFVSSIGLIAFIDASHAQKPAAYKPVILKTWDEKALADLEVPLAVASHTPKDISAEEYYRLPVRPII